MKFTKERLEELSIGHSGFNLRIATHAESMELARQMLASMEQEPVVFQCRMYDPLHDEWLEWENCTELTFEKLLEELDAPGVNVRKLYVAPPAPVVPEVVPDEVIVLLNHLEDVLPDDAFNLIDVKTWNNVSMLSRPDVYRAAMLQGAEPVNGDLTLREGLAAIRNSGIAIDAGKIQAERDALNAPVISDGYALVPVDMAPEMMRAVQLNSELGGYAAANLSGAYSLFREFWDVAIAAAPQQEVKS